MTARRRWTDATIETEIAPLVAELGRMPTRTELRDRGLGGAWSAMQRQGGLAAWRGRFAPARPDGRPSREDVAVRAYFIAQEYGGDPLANWLTAERELLHA
jgi:hypothetical protein